MKTSKEKHIHNSFDFGFFTSLTLSCPHGARCPWLCLGPTSASGALLLRPGLRGETSRCEGPDGGLQLWPSVILSWRGR